jgi:hypothetical protein
MCHGAERLKSGGAGLSDGDAGDLQAGEFAAMADRAVVPLAAAVLEGDHLVVLALRHDFGRDARAAEIGGQLRVFAVGVEEEIGEGRGAADLEVELFDIDDVPLCDAVLFTAGFENCVGLRSGKAGEKGRRACHGSRGSASGKSHEPRITCRILGKSRRKVRHGYECGGPH